MFPTCFKSPNQARKLTRFGKRNTWPISGDRIILAAIRNLGELQSEVARPMLIGRLAEYGVKTNYLNGNNERDIEAIILALFQIGGASACSSLVQFEIRSQNTELKAKAKKAADQICDQSRFTAK